MNTAHIRKLCGEIYAASDSTTEARLIEQLRREFDPGRSRPVTMAMAAELEAGGFHDTAEIARLYAIDRPRWWHRFKKKTGE